MSTNKGNPLPTDMYKYVHKLMTKRDTNGNVIGPGEIVNEITKTLEDYELSEVARIEEVLKAYLEQHRNIK